MPLPNRTPVRNPISKTLSSLGLLKTSRPSGQIKKKSLQRRAQRAAKKAQLEAELAKVKEQARIEKEQLQIQLNGARAEIPQLIEKGVKDELFKAKAIEQKQAHQFRYPERVNSNSDPERKPGSDIPFSFMRRMAQIYPIARACINRRIRQVTGLQWDITTIDDIEGEKGYESQIAQVRQFFKEPMGHKTRMREMLTLMVDDVLTIDAVCFEVQKTRGGQFYKLIPVDPTTIALRVTENGATPEPPDAAYEQIIKGEVVGRYTTDEMIYDFMNRRSMTPYGLAPMESLILQAESAIRGTLYNLNYLRENNVPEGFLMLPEEVAASKELVEQWQMWFDSMVAGDARFTHRLKILPGGAAYTPAKKPEDMSFEKFEMWLLQQTCAVFDVPPQEIGITYQVNKSTGKTQKDSAHEYGLVPLGNFIKEIFDDIVQNWMGFTSLQFMWHDLNPVDMAQEVDMGIKQINLGMLSVDEWRTEHGRPELGLDPYILVGNQIVMVDDIVSGEYKQQQQAQAASAKTGKTESDEVAISNSLASSDKKDQPTVDDSKKAMLEANEIKAWRKFVYNDLRLGRPIRRHFKSHHIPKETYELIREGLQKITSETQVKIFFDQFLDPEVKASMTLLNYAAALRKVEHEAHMADQIGS